MAAVFHPPESNSDLPKLAGQELARVSSNPKLHKSKVLKRLLAYLLECALSDRPVTEYTLAYELLGLSPAEFHPYTNPYVRVHMSLLRKRLRLIYAEGQASELILHIPSGSFCLKVERISLAQSRLNRAFSQAKLLAESRYIEELTEAVALFETILESQPAFASGWNHLCWAHISLAGHGGPPATHWKAARSAAAQANLLEPESSETLCSLASVAGLYDLDWSLCHSYFARALKLSGNGVMSFQWYHAFMVASGSLSQLLNEFESALNQFDMPPRSLQQNYGICLHLSGRFEQAEVELKRSTVLFPDEISSWFWLAVQHALQVSPIECLKSLSKAVSISRDRSVGKLFSSTKLSIQKQSLRRAVKQDGSASDMSLFFSSMVLRRSSVAISAAMRMVEARNPLAFILLRSPLLARLSHLPGYGLLFDTARIPRP